MNHNCASAEFGGASQAELCAPLAQLKKEHVSLREKMDAFAAMAAVFESNKGPADWRLKLTDLAEKVKKFADELAPHSEREEEALFPMMAKHIGREAGPIAVMEYEHEQAKCNLKLFQDAVRNLDSGVEIDAGIARAIASYAKNAYEILTAHFLKEENVLFPMAQQLLSSEEKMQLAQDIGTEA